MTRRAQAAMVASPVLVGAVTVLISVIAVFIAYNANRGLPFVPTYDLRAELPSGGKLVKGNEVRAGGFRVGLVEDIRPKVVELNGRRRAIAVIDLKLDKTVEPLARDTKLRVRPRSALGLKYVQLTPGRSGQTYQAGDTIPLRASSEPLELEDLFSMFDRETRPRAQAALEGFGDAFTGRGVSLNRAIGALNPFFRHLTPVMRNLSDPDTELDQFFLQIGRASAQAAPVARTQAVLFTNMADTFEAFSRHPRQLQATIEKSPPTLDVSISSLRVQRPFLTDFADLSRRLRPAAQELPRSLPAINRAFRVGTPVLPRTVPLNERLGRAFGALDDLFENPSTLLTIRDLDTAVSVGRPALEYIAPYQTVCNYFNYFIHPLGEHQSQVVQGGTIQNQGLKSVNGRQPNTPANFEASRRVDVPRQEDRRGRPQWSQDNRGSRNATFLGDPAVVRHSGPYPAAIDAQGNADCELGQTGYMDGPWGDFRYGPGVLADGTPTGGNFPVVTHVPGLQGGTDKARELGIDNLRDLP